MPSTVLFVDDDPILTDGLRRALHQQPFRVLTASSAEAAMEVLERESVEVIVSDEQMPGVVGSEFLAQVRHLYPGVQRLMLTGRASLAGAVHAINEGSILRFLIKPCPTEELVEAISQALHQKRLMDRCHQALLLLKRHAALIERIGHSHPEVLRRALSEIADLPIASDDFDTTADLASLMAVQVAQGGALLAPPPRSP